MVTPQDLTIVYYTANRLEETNPYFLANVEKQLVRAADGLPIVIVSQKPTMFGNNTLNVNLGDIGRSHFNIYYQIMKGCEAATTPYVAMAEDDILYSWEHFHSKLPEGEVFLYDMNKLSLFTWIKPAVFSFRHNRMVVNQLIAPRKMLCEAMKERFERLEVLRKYKKEEEIKKIWGDPGRYEKFLGVTVRPIDDFMCTVPSIVFSHEFAYGYETNQGKKKRLGDLRVMEFFNAGVAKLNSGKASEVLKLYNKDL